MLHNPSRDTLQLWNRRASELSAYELLLLFRQRLNCDHNSFDTATSPSTAAHGSAVSKRK